MKVLIVNTLDLAGGAARAAHRLHKALQGIGIDSQMLVQFQTTDDYSVHGPTGKLAKVWAKIRQTLETLPLYKYHTRQAVIFSPAWIPFSGLVDRINRSDADIVHLHWVNGGMMRIEDLQHIRKPIVWSLHDMWPMTGGCHYDQECKRYKQQCGSCPILGSNIDNDISAFTLRKKIHAISKMQKPIHIVGLSNWIAECAKESRLFHGLSVVTLPNPIDVARYYPVKKSIGRALFNLSENKKIILYGAMSATTDPRKGYSLLLDALRKMLDSQEIELVVFGCARRSNDPSLPYPVHYLGNFTDDVSLQLVYSAADVMVVPSLQENLSNAIMESLACGTPVVAFDTGGNGDLIDHQQNGYLAASFQPESLAQGIEWIINHPEPGLLAKAARDKVEKCFAMDKVARQYEALYQELLGENPEGS